MTALGGSHGRSADAAAAMLGLMMMVMMMPMTVDARGNNSDVNEAQAFLDQYDREAQEMYYNKAQKNWDYKTNITAETQKADQDARVEFAVWQKSKASAAAQYDDASLPIHMKRQFHFIRDIGTAALSDEDKLKRLQDVMGEMKTVYSTAKVCLEGEGEGAEEDPCLPFEPDIRRIFETSYNETLLRRLWSGWRNATGKKMRDLYTQFVSLSNEAMRTLGYADTGAYWRSQYETESFEQDIAALLEELRPFYEQLHAFVRRRLKQQYGEDVFPSSGHIPAHLLGNMWGQQWNSLLDILMPFPDKPTLDVTEQMVQQGYTAQRIFETADDFFTTLGLEPMPQSFWARSMLKKPTDGRKVVCQASATDFYNGRDFGIKQCTEATMYHFSTAHHEMGHVEYYLLYKHLPVVFRRGANPGFHEAVGDTISLSVETPKHLHKIGLLPTLVEDREADLNFLMAMALQKIAFLPFGYLIDQWRWSVFRGDTTPQNYNQAWWDLRCNLQGLSPPVKRTEEDFDPGAKYHIPHNTPYVRYFVSYVIQFQFHKALCQAAGHQGPLHTCDIYNSTQAGDKLRAMLAKGRSEVWTQPFKALTGRSQMSAQPLMEYFRPLMDFLQEANKGEQLGWTQGCPSLTSGSAGQLTTTTSVLLLMTMLLVLVTVFV